MQKPVINKLILLVNLGSPEELSTISIRKFLRSFLSDQRVVGLPRLFWYPILFGIILPLRVKKLLHKYQQIWHSSNKSPLTYYTQQQALLLQENTDALVEYAFCYGENTVHEQLTKLEQQYLFKNIQVIPLYPQYSSSTTAAVFDQIYKYYKTKYFIPSINFVNGFADNRDYILALADSIRKHWQQYGVANKLVVSFHSVPVKLIANGDIYKQECETTFKLLCQELNLSEDMAILCYQSKFGKAKWVEPATDVVIKSIAANTQVCDVICPGFVSDCLETLEEVAMMYRDLFKQYGGSELRYIPCLNDSSELINVLAKISHN